MVRIHLIIVMIRWTGLAPWEFEFPFPGSLTSTFLPRKQASSVTPTAFMTNDEEMMREASEGTGSNPSSSLLFSSLELSDTKVYEP